VVAARQLRALFGLLFSLSAWAQAGTVVAGKTGDGAALASVRSIGLGADSHCVGGHDR
jgi:hypothetical protein